MLKNHSSILLSLLSVCAITAQGMELTINGDTYNEDKLQEISTTYLKTDFMGLEQAQKEEIVNNIVMMEILFKEAKENGIDKTPEYLSIVEKVEKMILLDQYSKKLFNDTIVTDKEISKYYQANSSQFEPKDMVNMAQILVSTEEEAKKIIKEILSQRNREEGFKTSVRKYSLNPGENLDGNLGWFTKDDMEPEFKETLFKLAKNQISEEPIQSTAGWHVVMVVDKKKSEAISEKEFIEDVNNDDKLKEKIQYYIFEEEGKKNIEALKKVYNRNNHRRSIDDNFKFTDGANQKDGVQTHWYSVN
jgi:peptidyl-prolyl cis-trans isomerase C